MSTINITFPMITSATFAMEAAKKLQGTLALARARNILDKSEYESAATFLLRVADLCKAIAEERPSLIEYYAEKLNQTNEEEVEAAFDKAAPLDPVGFKNFLGWMEEFEKLASQN